MKKIILIIFILFAGFVKAQQGDFIKGVVKDSLGNVLVSATITLTNIKDSSVRMSSLTNDRGEFSFSTQFIEPGLYQLNINYVGYTQYNKVGYYSTAAYDLGTLILENKALIHHEVKITKQAQSTKMTGDTLQFNAGSFKTNPDATAEDLVKKMPGLTVENGQVKAQGEEVKKVTVDGKTYFGDDANAALKNISADMIDKVEVYDQMSDQAMFTGFDDGQSSKAMNLVTKNQLKNGVMGKVYAGYGTNNKYQAGLTYHNFKKDRKISLLGLSNNINIQNFSSDDLTTATGSAPQSSPYRGAKNNGPSNNLMTSPQSGINTVNSFGLNYSDVCGKKIKVSGSYFFNQGSNNNTQSLNRQFYASNDSSVHYNEWGTYLTTSYNHRFNTRFEYAIDSMNSILFTPTFSFQNSNNNNSVNGNSSVLQTLLNATQNDVTANSSSYKLGSDLLFRHRFTKKGRTISTNLHGDWNNKKSNNQLNALNQYFSTSSADTVNQHSIQNTPNNSYSANLTYTEPLGKIAQLLVAYKVAYNENSSQFNTLHFNDISNSYSVLDTNLSGNFNSNYYTQQIGPALRINIKKASLMMGADYQRVDMFNDQIFPSSVEVQRRFENVLPSATLKMKFSGVSNIKFNYKTQVNVPSVNQLQEIWNNSNPLLLTVGNASLKTSYSHNVNVRFMYNNKKSRSLMAFAMLNKTLNYISNATQLVNSNVVLSDGKELKQGTRYSQPINLDGYWNMRSYLMFSSPLKFIKCNFSLNGGFTYSTTPILLNGVKGYSQSYSYPMGLTLSSNISEKIDFSLSSIGSYNEVNNTLQSSSNNNYFNLLSTAKVNWTFWKGMVVQSEITHTWYTGLSSSFNRNYLLWNASLAKKFSKDDQGEFKISVFDVLQQNNSITRTVGDTYVEDLKNVVLQQYFMATFTYKFKKLNATENPSGK